LTSDAAAEGNVADTHPAPRRSARSKGRRRAAGIYGTIVTAAVIAAGGNQLSTAALEATVLVTLVVYWVAEQYAELLGEHAHAGRLPSMSVVRSSLAAAWPMVTASFIPLLSLATARLFGASAPGAADVALAVTLAMLLTHGHAAGRAAGLHGARLILVTATAGLLGIAMVVLKVVLQHHH
jgi:hypothetical protein